MHSRVEGVSSNCSMSMPHQSDYTPREGDFDVSQVRALGRIEAVAPVDPRGTAEAYQDGRKYLPKTFPKNRMLLVFNHECKAWKYQHTGEQFKDQLHAFVVTVHYGTRPLQRFEGPRFRVICARRSSNNYRAPSIFESKGLSSPAQLTVSRRYSPYSEGSLSPLPTRRTDPAATRKNTEEEVRHRIGTWTRELIYKSSITNNTIGLANRRGDILRRFEYLYIGS